MAKKKATPPPDVEAIETPEPETTETEDERVISNIEDAGLSTVVCRKCGKRVQANCKRFRCPI